MTAKQAYFKFFANSDLCRQIIDDPIFSQVEVRALSNMLAEQDWINRGLTDDSYKWWCSMSQHEKLQLTEIPEDMLKWENYDR
jgi:hypothetical protein